MNRLFASLPPLVNTILKRLGRDSAKAISSRACSIFLLASTPAEYTVPELA